MSQFYSQNTKQPCTKSKKKTGGRPRSDIALVRHKTIGVRVNNSEWEELRKKANAMHLTPSHWLRLSGLQKRLPPAPVPTINRLAYVSLLRLSVNINQLVKSVHMGKADIPMPFLLELKQTIALTQNQLMGLDNTKDNEALPCDS